MTVGARGESLGIEVGKLVSCVGADVGLSEGKSEGEYVTPKAVGARVTGDADVGSSEVGNEVGSTVGRSVGHVVGV